MPRFNPLPPVITRPAYEFTLSATYNSQTIVNVFHFVQSAGATTLPTLDVLRAALYAHFTPEFLDLHQEDYLLNRVTLQRFDIPGSVVSVSNPAAAGTIEGEGLPPQDSAGIRLITGWPGQRGRGYKRLGGLPESAQSAGVFTNAYKLLLADFATLCDESVGTANPTDGQFVPHVLTREITFDPLPVCTVYGAEVTEHLVKDYVGTQNSRKIRSLA